MRGGSLSRRNQSRDIVPLAKKIAAFGAAKKAVCPALICEHVCLHERNVHAANEL
jgi:hypothetical protein